MWTKKSHDTRLTIIARLTPALVIVTRSPKHEMSEVLAFFIRRDTLTLASAVAI